MEAKEDVETVGTNEGYLLNINDSATLLKVSPYTIRAWIRKGMLRATKLGRLVRVESKEVQRFVDAGRKKDVQNAI